MINKIFLFIVVIFNLTILTCNAKIITEKFGNENNKIFSYDDEQTLVLSPLIVGKTYYLPSSKDPFKYLGTYPGRYSTSKIFRLNDNEIIYFDDTRDSYIWSNHKAYKIEKHYFRGFLNTLDGFIYILTIQE